MQKWGQDAKNIVLKFPNYQTNRLRIVINEKQGNATSWIHRSRV